MGKFLILLLLGLVAWFAIRALAGGRSRRADREMPAEDMVACAHCGLNVPRTEALPSRGRFYCSEEHLRQRSGTP